MSKRVVLVSIPGLRRGDLAKTPALSSLTSAGDTAEICPSFPAVTCPVQANMTTGQPPSKHGVVANGFYWRDKQEVEMWTAWNDCIQEPQIWDLLHQKDPSITSAVWFPLHSKGCGADYVCTPAPIHNPDGSESLWCFTKPDSLYEELLGELGHFPLQHFWGPLAGIQGTTWIVASAVRAAEEFHPNFAYIYLPHLDYASQKTGPNSDAAQRALSEIDSEIAKLVEGFNTAYDGEPLTWIVASEYAVNEVDHVVHPNRLLREAGLLSVIETDNGEQLDLEASHAWALVDHQFSHVFVRDADTATIPKVADLFRQQAGISKVLEQADLATHHLDHPRSGELVLASEPHSWQAYYWWLDDLNAPSFARTVDIHRKPGYDPVELFFDPASKGIPLDSGLVRGSHGAMPDTADEKKPVILCSQGGVLPSELVRDVDVAGLVMGLFERAA